MPSNNYSFNKYMNRKPEQPEENGSFVDRLRTFADIGRRRQDRKRRERQNQLTKFIDKVLGMYKSGNFEERNICRRAVGLFTNGDIRLALMDESTEDVVPSITFGFWESDTQGDGPTRRAVVLGFGRDWLDSLLSKDSPRLGGRRYEGIFHVISQAIGMHDRISDPKLEDLRQQSPILFQNDLIATAHTMQFACNQGVEITNRNFGLVNSV